MKRSLIKYSLRSVKLVILTLHTTFNKVNNYTHFLPIYPHLLLYFLLYQKLQLTTHQSNQGHFSKVEAKIPKMTSFSEQKQNSKTTSFAERREYLITFADKNMLEEEYIYFCDICNVLDIKPFW